MPTNPTAENVLGTIGTVLWCGQLLPQIWKSWREKSTEGLSHWLALSWCISAVFLGIYAIVQDLNIPLIVQPQLFGLLCGISWAQCLYYGKRMSALASSICLVILLAAVGGVEAGGTVGIRHALANGHDQALLFVGIMSSVFLSIGLLPQYYEIYRHREVIGISLPFMLIDLLGGVFSDLSLVFKPPPFQVLPAIAYTLVVVLDGIVIIAALILNPRMKRRRRREAAEAEAIETSTATSNREGPSLPQPTITTRYLNDTPSTSDNDYPTQHAIDPEKIPRGPETATNGTE